METKHKTKFNLRRLDRLPEFWKCSVRQRFWLQCYLAGIRAGITAPAVFATQSAYATEGENGRTFSYQVLKSPKIRAVLKVFGVKTKKGKSNG